MKTITVTVRPDKDEPDIFCVEVAEDESLRSGKGGFTSQREALFYAADELINCACGD